MENEMTSKHNLIGSHEWLQMHAWFPCQHCEESNEPTVHRAVDLKIWDGMTICDECWSNYNQGPIPERWPELDPFEPFRCLSEQRSACTAVLDSLEKLATDGEIIWLDPPHVLPGVHESAIERLKSVIEQR